MTHQMLAIGLLLWHACYNMAPMKHQRMLLPALLLLLASLAGCAIDRSVLQPEPARPSASPSPGSEPHGDDTGWQRVDTAMELRTMRLAAGATSDAATIVRFDPATYRVRVKYDVQNAGTVREWYEALRPLAVINGGYFDTNGRATALVVFDGIRRGVSYEGFGGMVAINAQGDFELRSLSQQPYDENEPLQQAMQSAPMLIQPGGELAAIEDDDVDRSRRSVIARDRSGRILLIVSRSPTFTLRELAQALHDSDLEIDAALNLDGGRSTGLYLRTDAVDVAIDSFERVPLVLVVEERVS
jgi:uncharacterized protein YigE (DUF2233 family)